MDDSPEVAWHMGRIAGRKGVPAEANPYPADNEVAPDWEGGRAEGLRERNRRGRPHRLPPYP